MQEINKNKGKRAKIDKVARHIQQKCGGLRNIQGQRSTPSIQTTQFKPEIKITFLLFEG